MAPYGPGTYLIKLNGSCQPSLYTFDGKPIDDPRFESFGNASFFFSLAYVTSLAFSQEPMTWHDGDNNRLPEPFGNGHRLVEEVKVLILNVTPPIMDLGEPQHHHFTLHLNVGGIHDHDDVLWMSDGSRPLDPTIIEKPPEQIPPPGEDPGDH